MMNPQFRPGGGKTVRFLHRQLTGVDAYGNDVYGSLPNDVQGCAVAPGNSTQDWQGTEQIQTDVTVYAPAKTMVNLPVDQMIIDGQAFNVVGDPSSWASPFTGSGSFLEVRGKFVSTGGGVT